MVVVAEHTEAVPGLAVDTWQLREAQLAWPPGQICTLQLHWAPVYWTGVHAMMRKLGTGMQKFGD